MRTPHAFQHLPWPALTPSSSCRPAPLLLASTLFKSLAPRTLKHSLFTHQRSMAATVVPMAMAQEPANNVDESLAKTEQKEVGSGMQRFAADIAAGGDTRFDWAVCSTQGMRGSMVGSACYGVCGGSVVVVVVVGEHWPGGCCRACTYLGLQGRVTSEIPWHHRQAPKLHANLNLAPHDNPTPPIGGRTHSGA